MFSSRRLLVDVTQSINGTRPSRANANEAHFDTNMVIILAALLLTLICALGLNSMVRFVLRCTRRFGNETPEQAVVRLANTGVKKRTLQKIPVVVYGSGLDLKVTECPICLGDFVEGHMVRVLPKCNHGFHVKCIDKWLVSHSSCPNCRCSLLERSTSRVADENSAAQAQENLSGQQTSGVAVVVDRVAAC